MDILPGSLTHFWPGLVGSPAYPFAHLKSREILVRKWSTPENDKFKVKKLKKCSLQGTRKP